MDGGSPVYAIAASRDGKWIMSGTIRGLVTVWNAESNSKVTEVRRHSNRRPGVCAVDVSPDGSRIATGSDDYTVCVWSLSTGDRLLRPFKHDGEVAAVKFSPNGGLIATATWCRASVRVYDSQNGFLVGFPVEVGSWLNQSLAWASDSKRLFALSHDGNIHWLDVSSGTTLSKWGIHSSNGACIALASNGTFIAASAGSSTSFWGTTTHDQIGSVVEHTHVVESMAILSNYDLVTGGDKKITLLRLCDILPSRYVDNVRIFA